MSSNHALTLFFLMTGIAACGAGQAPPETPASGQANHAPAKEPTQAGTTTPPGAQLQGAGQGPASAEVDRKSSECKFVIPGDRCFVIQSAACAAAGCDPAKCLSAETFPAQISCKK